MSQGARTLIAVLAIVLVLAFVWKTMSHNGSKSGSTEFSSWSRTVASPELSNSESLPTTDLQRNPQNTSRKKIDLQSELKRRRAGLPLNAEASSVQRPTPAAIEAFKKLPRIEAHTINSRNYQVLGAWAVPRDQYRLSQGEPLQYENNYNLVAVDPSVDVNESWRTLTVRPDTRPVLISPDTGRVAIVTGTLEVTFKKDRLEKVGAIADSENLQVLKVDASIFRAYYHAPAGYSLIEGLERIQANFKEDIEQVELELDQARKAGK